jgi:hypothetical protein
MPDLIPADPAQASGEAPNSPEPDTLGPDPLAYHTATVWIFFVGFLALGIAYLSGSPTPWLYGLIGAGMTFVIGVIALASHE